MQLAQKLAMELGAANPAGHEAHAVDAGEAAKRPGMHWRHSEDPVRLA